MKRILVLLTVGAMIASIMALFSGVALAQGGADVCVSNKGETKVDKGDSTCSSDSTSHAVAHNDSQASADDNSQAKANNSSFAAGGTNFTGVRGAGLWPFVNEKVGYARHQSA